MSDIPENREIVMTDSAPDHRTALLVEMSRDLGIQAEIAAIDREFAVAEMDGLFWLEYSLPHDCSRSVPEG